MRLPYVSDPPPTTSPTEAAIVDRVRTRRGPRGFIPLDLALMHSFPVTDGWNSFVGAIRTQTSLSPDIREIAICRVALLNEAWFEWDAHSPLLADVHGFSSKAMDVIAEVNPKGQGALTGKQWAVVRYADAMTRDVKVSEEVFGELKKEGFNEKEIVEITATVASYNCVSRFLVALDVGEKNR